MGVEIDILAVGDGERSGDAIAIRYGTPLFGYRVMIIDGGTKESGEQLVQHVQTVYGTDRADDVLNTHPDGDHSSGLRVVVENLETGRLWMHRPWNHAEKIRHLFHDGRITDNSLEQRYREALQSAHELEAAALARQIPISEPYQGAQIGPFTVLSPEANWYVNELVPNFRGAPALKQQLGFDAMLKAILLAIEVAAHYDAALILCRCLAGLGQCLDIEGLLHPLHAGLRRIKGPDYGRCGAGRSWHSSGLLC